MKIPFTFHTYSESFSDKLFLDLLFKTISGNAGGPQLANYEKFSYSGVPLNRYVDRNRHKKVFQRKRIMIFKFVPYCQRHESILLWNILEDLVSLETFYLKISKTFHVTIYTTIEWKLFVKCCVILQGIFKRNGKLQIEFCMF